MSGTRWIASTACLCVAFMNLAGQAAEQAEKPNLLFIFTDDQRWDAMSVV